MLKTQALSPQEQRFIQVVADSIKREGAGISRLRQVQLTAMVLQRTGQNKAAAREDKLSNAMARGLSVREKMAEEEGGNMSAEETARQLGLTKQSVLNLYHAGKVLAWKTDKQGALRFPVWQFVGNTRLPGLEAVLGKLKASKALDDWGKIGFFLLTHGSLGDRRPLDLLRENSWTGPGRCRRLCRVIQRIASCEPAG